MVFARVWVLKAYIEESAMNSPAAINRAVHTDVKAELIRKSIHFLIALSPGMAALHYTATMALLAAGIAGYASMELMRLFGVKVPLISSITSMASRPRELNRFVLGPVTLGLGAVCALLFFPLPAASIAIYALAFGDGLASLAGKLYGRVRPAFLFGKSIEGSTACFIATFIFAWLVSSNPVIAFTAALTATTIEALPLGDYDNIALPLAVGMTVILVM